MKLSTDSLSENAKILFVALQLGALLFVFREFALHDQAFRRVSLLIFGGFIIHAFLPTRFRLPFFLFLSVTSVFFVLDLVSGAWLLGIGITLIAITYLPFGFYTRVGLILGAVALLAASRAGWIPTPWTGNVWPILAAMFMFRMIIYLYDIHHEKKRPAITQTLSYFFMLPNVCFPLFPVVDYKKFQRNYYNEEAYRIYQRGISWILRGVIHLLLYRYVYQNLTLDPTTVSGLSDVLQFSFSAFLLYLQVSGSYHMIVGILLLFGFNLPETNHLYFLASSVNDFWRRINIYWKDFMMKIFYYPVYFRVRQLGEAKAIAISASVVFFATWFLHAYQWFWLRGTWLLEWHDALYWAILALLVIGNSLYESKYGRERSLSGHSKGVLDHVATALSTVGIFLIMGLLWGMWSSDSMGQWLAMWGTTDFAWAGFMVLIPSLFVVSMGLQHLAKLRRKAAPAEKGAPRPRPSLKKPSPPEFWKPALVSAAGIVVVYALGNLMVISKLPVVAQNVLEDVRVARLNDRDQAQLVRGYYDNLITVNRSSSALWSRMDQRPADWTEPSVTGTRQRTHDVRVSEFTPNKTYTFKRAEVSINRWGLRDKDYTLEKPEGTIRIALLGQSYVVGSGVNNPEIFEAVLEERLNQRADASANIEILNFATPDRGPVTQVAILEEKVLPFKPDILLYVGQKLDWRQSIDDLRKALDAEVEIGYPTLTRILEEAGPFTSTGEESAQLFRMRLTPYSEEILEWAYNRMVETSREHDIEPVFVYLPSTDKVDGVQEEVLEMAMAANAGFDIIDLGDVFAGQNPPDLHIATWDGHPNSKAHKLIANRLYDILTTEKSELIQPETHQVVGNVPPATDVN